MISEKDIRRIATLAKLEIADKDVPFYINEMQTVLDFAEEIIRSGESRFEAAVEPVDYNLLRADDVLPSVSSKEILSNASSTQQDFFLLRKQA